MSRLDVISGPGYNPLEYMGARTRSARAEAIASNLNRSELALNKTRQKTTDDQME